MASPEETRVQNLESELSLLKNQVQQTLLDIREHVLEFTNPFTAEARLVRAWQERTAQAAQTNLGGEADLESLMDVDDDYEDDYEDDAQDESAAAPAAAPAGDSYDADLLEDDVEYEEVESAPPPAQQAAAPAPASPEAALEEEWDDGQDEAVNYEEPAGYDTAPAGYDAAPASYDGAGYDNGAYQQPGYDDYEDEFEPAAPEQPRYDDGDTTPAAGEATQESDENNWDESAADGMSEMDQESDADFDPEMELEYGYEDEEFDPEAYDQFEQEPATAPVQQQPIQQLMAGQSSMDMIKMISLVKWVDQNIDRIGKDRVIVILDIHAMSGRITEEIRDIVKRLCALDRDDDTRVPVRDVVAAMLTIDDVLDDQQSQSRRLMSMLLDDPFGGMPRGGEGLL